ncbi:unnamed protein product [Leptidea sinapis]|uniref:FHA domain-containing protein n=1 Tax=Leptidea sinapis TaxID=189913 RepID=A0A5E4PVJ9_9NEOP|nr:unnamed protein product [Leptidea sinapis]
MAGVDPHHATAVIRSVSTGETFVNGQPISVAALRHNDIISVGGRNIPLVCKRRGASASKLRRRTEESGANRSQQVSSPRRSGAPAHRPADDEGRAMDGIKQSELPLC